MSRSVVHDVFIQAPPDVVWQALTDAKELTQWFPVEARVRPGVGGSIWFSWGEGAAGESQITAWEPGRHFQWTEDRGPVKIAVDFHLDARDGGTVVRLVQSGFGDGAEWDDEFHMVEGGWSYFMTHLRWYLERHRGTRRDLIGFRERTALTRDEAFNRLLRLVDGLEVTRVVDSPKTGQAGFTIPSLGDAILFIEIEPGADAVRGGFWLSTYGLASERLASLRAHFTQEYRRALDGTQGGRQK